MRRAILRVVIVLALGGCADAPGAAAEPCRRAVDAFEQRDLRCGLASGVDYEREIAGEAGCDRAISSRARDWDALAGECADALATLPCESVVLPEACTDQIR